MFSQPPRLRLRLCRGFWLADDDGMTTVEYCVGLMAAAALAVVLYGIVTGDGVLNALTSIVQRAFTVSA